MTKLSLHESQKEVTRAHDVSKDSKAPAALKDGNILGCISVSYGEDERSDDEIKRDIFSRIMKQASDKKAPDAA